MDQPTKNVTPVAPARPPPIRIGQMVMDAAEYKRYQHWLRDSDEAARTYERLHTQQIGR